MIEETKHKDTLNSVLPAGWDVVMLGDVADFSRKPRSLNFNKYKKIPFIPMEYIPNEEIYISKYELKNQNEIKSWTFFCKGDLLVAKITPSFENGKQCIINDLPTDFGYATTEVWPLHGTDRCDILYLFFYLKKHEIRTEIAAKMEGSTGRQRVPKSVLANFRIPLPPLPEQQKIAEVISTVQQAKEKTDAVISATKELKKSLMKHLFSYGPVPVKKFDVFCEFDEFNELGVNELQNAQNSSNPINLKETEIGLVPEEWELIPLGDLLAIVLRNGVYKPRTAYGKGNIRIIQLNDIYSPNNRIQPEQLDTLDISEPEMKKYEVLCGDIIINRVSKREEGVGAVAIVEPSDFHTVFESNMFRVRFDQSKIFGEYFLLYGQSNRYHEQVMQRATKANQTSINQKNLCAIPVPIPELAIQKNMIEMLKAIENKIEAEQAKKKSLNVLFKSFLHNLMTGKLRVNEL